MSTERVLVDFKSLKGAADFLGNGAIETNKYETEIFDIVRRRSVALKRLPTMRANGHPHRYFDQTAIAQAKFDDPRNLSPTPTGPTRTERYAPIKAMDAQTNITLFDKEVTQQQGQFAYVVAKDIDDIISGIDVLRAEKIWTGNDTSFSAPTSLEYFGLLTQITNSFTITQGSSIIDALKSIVASMAGNQSFKVIPSAIYMNPVLGDYIDREAKASQITFNETEVTAGVTVQNFSTQVGKLPMVPEAFIPATTDDSFGFDAPPAGLKNYFAVILTESAIEIPYISGEVDNPNPRLFQLGLTGNLTGQFVGVKFDTIIAKGAAYNHAVVCVQRP